MNRKLFLAVALLLVLNATAFSQSAPSVTSAAASSEIKQVQIKSVLYTAPPDIKLGFPLDKMPQPLVGGIMKTVDFERTFSKLVTDKKIKVGSRPSGSAFLGSLFELKNGTEPRLSTFRLITNEFGDDGQTYLLEIDLSAWEGNYRQALSTGFRIKADETAIISTGAVPDGSLQTFFAISVTPSALGGTALLGTAQFSMQLTALQRKGIVKIR